MKGRSELLKLYLKDCPRAPVGGADGAIRTAASARNMEIEGAQRETRTPSAHQSRVGPAA